MSLNNSHVTEGVVLTRRPYGEYDLIATLYTEAFGKLPARFIGVRRPKGKLKALAEPMVHGEYRLYIRPGSEWATATGGRIVSSFPGLRVDFDRTVHGLRLCELLLRLAPDRAPNRLEHALIVASLASLERTGSPWIATAFALRLLELAGFGLARLKPEETDPALWRALHEEPLETLERRPDAESSRLRIEGRVERAYEQVIERPLSTSIFNESLRRTSFSSEAAA
ncbi:MAG: DNA repair protein RecO [Elusimicrobia bacterium]|nr:DNA repair protein RecO [Elusimicrobiota bacterium]